MAEKGKIKSEKTEDFDVQKIISRGIDHWKLFVLSFIGFMVLGVLFILFATPYYEINSQVYVEDDQNSGSALSLIGGNSSSTQALSSLFGIKSNVYNELYILETPDLLEKVTKEMTLNITYFAEDPVNAVELYKASPFKLNLYPSVDTVKDFVLDVSFPKNGKRDYFNLKAYSKFFGIHLPIKLSKTKARYGDSIHTAFGTIVLTPTGLPYYGNNYEVDYIEPDEEVYDLQGDMTYEIIDDNATVIALTLNSTVPQKGEQVMQRLIDSYIARDLNEKNRISDSTLSFIKGQVDIVSKDLNNIELQIQGFKEKNKIADLTDQAKALVANSSDYYNKLNEIDVQLSVVKTMLESVTQDTKRPVPTLINADPNFVALVQKYNSLISDRDRLLLSTTEANPLVQNVDVQLNAARADMVKSLENQQTALQTTRTNLVAQNGQIGDILSNVPSQERQYVDLTREQDVKQALYLFLLQQGESTAITKASNFPTASVIAVPKSEYKPYFPSKIIVIAISILLGLMFPTGFVILKYILNPRILSREDIEDRTDCTILAEIGHSKSKNILMEEQSRSIMAEQFRIFRTNMDFITGQKECPKILITSSMSGEGKSFIGINLAQVYAFSGKKVLLVEMDLRKPKISSMLDLPNVSGFSNYIISNQRIQQFVQPIPDSKNIFLLGSGPIPPNPAELLMSPKVDEMFAELSKIFDVIIIDSPPIGAVVDSQLLNRISDVNLYIVRQRYSFKSSMNIVNDIIEKNKFSNLYLVVNDVKKTTSYKYGYGGSGYGYGYSYGTEKKSKRRKS